MKGLGNEVAKNLVLAGVNSMTILDHEELTKEDSVSSFLAPTDQIGKLQLLNTKYFYPNLLFYILIFFSFFLPLKPRIGLDFWEIF